MLLRDLPIQKKLVGAILLTNCVLLLLTWGAFVVYEVLAVRQGMVRSLTTRAEIIAANSSASVAFQNESDAHQVLASVKTDPRTQLACIYDNSGQIFARYPADAPLEAFPAAPKSSGHVFGKSHLEVYSPINEGNLALGTVYLRSDLSAISERLRAFGLLALFVIFGSILIAYLLSRTLQKQVAMPILALADTARAVADRRDFSVRTTKTANDEIGLLSDAFNQMLSQIEEQNQALQASERRFRALIEHSSDSIAVVDAENKILYVSPAVESVEGYTPQELMGRRGFDDTHPDDVPLVEEFVRQLLASPEKSLPVVWRRRHKNGRWLWLEGVATNLLHDPAVKGIVTNYRDITERKEAEKREAVFARLAQSLSAVATPACAAQVITDAADELFGWDACSLDLYSDDQDLIFPVLNIDVVDGKRVEVPPAYNAEPPSLISRKVLTAGGQLILREPPFDFTRDAVPFGNHHRPSASLIFVPIRRGEKIIGILSIQSYRPGAYDQATLQSMQAMADQCGGALERVRAEDDLRKLNEQLEQRVLERTAQLQAVNKELEAFSYSVSHDLRAPLRHINGFADLLRKSDAERLSPDGKRFLDIISESGTRMGALIDDLLVFSRMGRSEMRRTNVAMGPLVAEVMAEMDRELEGRKIEWSIADLPEVNGDRAMLKQVWVNLISNAVKYTRQCEVAKITIACDKTDHGTWDFYVRDNGAGFDMRYAGKLFGVFQRLHRAEEFEGTGIGLANVRRIVLRHGGETSAEGEVGKGATLHFTLPISDPVNSKA